MSKASQFIILCEDKLQEVFVRKFLKNYDVPHRAIYPVALPNGNGCGEQHVRTRYPKEIRAYRDRQSKAKTVLIVVIDADTGTVENRQSQLNNAAQSAGVAPRSDGEHVVHLVPKRHIETWLAFLSNANDVNEDAEYKPLYSFRGNESKSHSLVDMFTGMFRHHQPAPESLPSLKQALEELERLREIL